jgi:hypothetical protein
MSYKSDAWKKIVPEDIQQLYEVHDFKHAATILRYEFEDEYNEIINGLRQFRLSKNDIIEGGGNESQIPKKFSSILRPKWVEMKLKLKMVVNDEEELNHDTHWIDYVNGRVAFDLEWNSKDQTFDRDLFAFKSFFDCNRISVGILVTRSGDLNPLFDSLGVKKKYGASTTHMGKLLPRLNANRNGGCPILVFGIKQGLVEGVT